MGGTALVAVVCGSLVSRGVEAVVGGSHLNRSILAIREIDTRSAPY
jgi:hypothetical protein